MDANVTNCGSIFLLEPVSEEGRDWCSTNLPEDAMRMGEAYVVEHRYINPIVYGMMDAGLVVE